MKKFVAFLMSIILFSLICLAVSYPYGRVGIEMSYASATKNIVEDNVTSAKVIPDTKTATMLLKDGTKVWVELPDSDDFILFATQKIQEGIEFDLKIDNSYRLLRFLAKILDVCLKIGLAIAFILFVIAVIKFPSTFAKNSDINMYRKKYDKDTRKLMKSLSSADSFDHIDSFNIFPVKTEVKFEDVAGIEEVKDQILDIVDYLKHPDKYIKIGAKLPKGVLLSGKPGTGKTLLAKAIAGEAGVSFFQTTGSSFDEKYVGVGASRIRKLFKMAKAAAPAIIFIDEFDSVAKDRYTDINRTHEQSINQLLAEMDGFESSNTVVVIAATNHIEVLDEAIIRPGRFDRHIEIPMPGLHARELILKLHAKNKVISDEVSLEGIARRTVGFSGADLANLLNESAIYAVRTGKSIITNDAIDEAMARIMVGLKNREDHATPEEIHLSAIHEAGHAIVSAVFRPDVKNICISIVSRGSAGGYNFFNEKDSNLKSKEELINHIRVAYGGRAAEEVILGSISTGASSDLKIANTIALQMVENYAMSDSLLVKVDNMSEYNKMLATKAMEKVESICRKAYEEAKEAIAKYAGVIVKLANLLEEKEYLSEKEVADFMSENI